jgi:hypothetical protein
MPLDDLSFRPASYFGPVRLDDHVTSKITGHVRQRLVKDALDAAEEVPPELLNGTLDSATLEAVTSLHPSLLGGEFLPEHEAGEVEIARISLASTTSDQVVVRARRVGQRIRYSVHDEYNGEFINPKCRPRSSKRPLTLRQLTDLIDSAYDLYDVIDMNIFDGGADVRDMANFVTASSAFYPQLEGLYEQWIREYLATRHQPEEAANDEGDDERDDAVEGSES